MERLGKKGEWQALESGDSQAPPLMSCDIGQIISPL